MPGIYKITCEANKKSYIGSTKNAFEARKNNHWADLRRGAHRNPSMQAAWNKYGEEAFSWEILLHCEEECLLKEEDRLMQEYDTMSPKGFNLKTAERPVVTDETRERMSQSKMGEKNSFYGRTHSPETIEILREKCGYEIPEEQRKKISDALKKRWADPESGWRSEHLSELRSKRLQDKDHPCHLAAQTPEAQAKRSAAMKKYWEGREISEETAEKQRNAAFERERSKTPEQRAEISRKISEARKRSAAKKKGLSPPQQQ